MVGNEVLAHHATKSPRSYIEIYQEAPDTRLQISVPLDTYNWAKTVCSTSLTFNALDYECLGMLD